MMGRALACFAFAWREPPSCLLRRQEDGDQVCSSHLLHPRLGRVRWVRACRVAERAMSSLQETHEAVLQYLEAAQEGQLDAQAPLVLAAMRSLGRCALLGPQPRLSTKSLRLLNEYEQQAGSLVLDKLSTHTADLLPLS
jgi:hypothetical protein